jgi:hypothetical protein
VREWATAEGVYHSRGCGQQQQIVWANLKRSIATGDAEAFGIICRYVSDTMTTIVEYPYHRIGN